jgi:hypothetical protein
MRRVRRLRQHVGLGRLLRPVVPPSRRKLVFQAMLSAVAGALGARDGVVVTDRLSPTSGITDQYTQWVVTIRPGRPEEVLGTLDGNARALGYVRDDRSWPAPATIAPRFFYRYERVRHLPDLAFALASPEELRGFAVPDGWVGVVVDIRTGMTESEDGAGFSKAPNTATRIHLAGSGVDITPPPRARPLTWWVARVAMQARLHWAMRRLGAYRGRLVATWLVGGEFTGPYTLGVMTIRRATTPAVLDGLIARAAKMGYHQGAHVPTAPRTPVLNLTTYKSGEVIDADGRRVPDDSVAVIVTLTAA